VNDRTVENPVTGEKATYVETSRETSGARTVMDFEVAGGGGVPAHRHATHQEQIEVLDGEIEVTAGGATRRYGSGERAVLPPQTVHAWRNPSSGKLRARVTYTPGHPGFEAFFRVWCGLARDGAVRPSGLPRRFADLALLGALDPSLFSGPLRLVAPLMRWTARRDRERTRAAALLRRYGCDARQADVSA
jgi:quercetin dioxygenase-like cupin family protein